MKKSSFYSYVYKKEGEGYKPESKEFQDCFSKNLDFFPHFPDVKLICELSYQNYERKTCTAKLVFLPFESLRTQTTDNPLVFSYANKEICFVRNQIRLIRKVAESLDKNHALVLYRCKSGIYCFGGIINVSDINKSFSNYYFISINGYSNWSAHCKSYNLFDYKNGYFCDYHKEDKDFTEQAKNVINYFKICSFSSDWRSLNKIMKTIKMQDHGTSFVVFKDAGQARREAERLCCAQRGFLAEKPLEYRELIKCISQFTKIDGGLLLDSNLTCYAYGCIYDGTAKPPFKGSLAYGSRFNSTALYTYELNNPLTHVKPLSEGQTDEERLNRNRKTTICCVGVVFSDDGGVKIAEIGTDQF